MEAQITITNDCSLDRVGQDYKAIIEDAVGAYRRNLDKILLSVRLMGSVPRGEATFGSSDINFVALVAMNPGADQRSMLASESKRLTGKYSCVSQVDLKIEIKGRIPAALDFIFRSDSICVWGDDTYPKANCRMTNVALSKLVTPDFIQLQSGLPAKAQGSNTWGRIRATLPFAEQRCPKVLQEILDTETIRLSKGHNRYPRSTCDVLPARNRYI